MDVQGMLARAPAALAHSARQPEVGYTLVGDVVAAHGAGGALRDGACAASIVPVEEEHAGTVGPVYRRDGGGGLVVPTGAALVRFADGDRAEDHRDAIAAAGYELEQALSYAPQAAIVRPRSGEIVDGLRGLTRLARLPGVLDVEPQLLSEAARRD